MSTAKQFTTPVGRLVWGSLYVPRDKDAEGKPLVIKTGPSAGQPTKKWDFGVAVPKGAEQHWNQTQWGQLIWQTGHAGFPGGQANAPTFAWKVTDGDSQIPNRKGRKPVDQEGYPRHWILSFSSSYPPRTYNADGSKQYTEQDGQPIKNGHYVQVAGNVDSNGSANQPGVYLNHNMVAHSGYGAEIISGPDATAVGFGQSPLPPGASTVPVGGMVAGVPTGTAQTTGYVGPAGSTGAVAGAPVVPHYPILGAGAALASPVPAVAPLPPVAVPVIPAVPVVPQMTAKAAGATYEQFKAQGWSDDMMRAQGYLA